MQDTNIFSTLPVSESILRAISEMGFSMMTDIQASAIPLILGGADIIGRSATGTGKTVAFGIPAIELASQKQGTPSVLILAPTRELAVQITDELRKLSKYTEGVSVATIYGGQPMQNQIKQLKNAKIVVGTPGRLMDHMRRKTLKLGNVSMVVLDEADEMLNMGFVDDITTILKATPEDRQTLLFSATMPPAIVKITGEFQKLPQMVAVDGGKRITSSVNQHYYVVPQARKTDTLKLLLETHNEGKNVVFCNTKKMVDELVEELTRQGYACAGLHGDMKQAARNSVMASFKSGKVRTLVATDVAARGIDVNDIEAVFNYDIPKEYEFYIHRIGRAGRAGKSGESYTIATGRQQIQQIRGIEKHTGTAMKEEPLPNVEDFIQKRIVEIKESLREHAKAEPKAEWTALVKELAEEGYSAEAQAAALFALFAEKDKKLAKLKIVSPFATSKNHALTAANTTWLQIDIGAKEKIGPNFIVGAIVEASGLTSVEIGKIDIFDKYTLVEVSNKHVADIVDSMFGTKIKGKLITVSVYDRPHTPKAEYASGGRTKSRSTRSKSNHYMAGKRKNAKKPNRKNS